MMVSLLLHPHYLEQLLVPVQVWALLSSMLPLFDSCWILECMAGSSSLFVCTIEQNLAGSVILLLLLVGAEFDNPNPDAPWGTPLKLYEEDDVVGSLLKVKHPVIWSSLSALACRSKPLLLPFFLDSLSSICVVSGSVPVLSPSSSN